MEVLPYTAQLSHPRFFAFVPGPSNFVSVLADTIAAGHNIFAGSWLEASGPEAVELVTIEWLCQLTGFPSTAGGIFLSGGSVANLTALATAREVRLSGEQKLQGVVYLSDQTHSSIERALKLLGLSANQIRKIRSDENFRLCLNGLRSAILADRREGRLPFCVVANAGTTNTGAIDPLSELAKICREEDLWLHVDGAYGAAALFSQSHHHLLLGIREADSLTIDPHKWLFQPYDCGCLLLRERALLKQVFHLNPEYLEDAEPSEHEINLWDYGPELTRPFRALKLWMSLQVFGADAFSAAVERGIELAMIAERRLREIKGWELITPAQLGIITFRHAPAGYTKSELNTWNRELGRRISSLGHSLVLSTSIRGDRVLRLCTINPRTRKEDIFSALDALFDCARNL
jgi:glutamate/tyrosine decarboxylase-like PLP-dependent enzyme